MIIEIGKWYEGGKVRKEKRFVIGFGSSSEWVRYGLSKHQLPYGGFMQDRCISRKAFIKWLNADQKQE